MSFSRLISALKKIDIEGIILDVIGENEEFISELNRKQLLEGKTSTGELLPDYSEASVVLFGKRPGPWTLFDTGDFHESIFVGAEKFPVFLDATDVKTETILKKLEARGYDSIQIFGLTEENLDKLRERIKAGLGAKVRKLLGI